MKVRATKRGYIDHSIREPGDEFAIPDEPKNPKTGKPVLFSERWMEPVEEEAAGPKAKAKK